MILLYAVTPKKMFLLSFVTLRDTLINFSDIEWRKEFIKKVAINKSSLLVRETAPFYLTFRGPQSAPKVSAAGRIFHYTMPRSFCQAIFSKKLHKDHSQNLYNLYIAI